MLGGSFKHLAGPRHLEHPISLGRSGVITGRGPRIFCLTEDRVHNCGAIRVYSSAQDRQVDAVEDEVASRLVLKIRLPRLLLLLRTAIAIPRATTASDSWRLEPAAATRGEGTEINGNLCQPEEQPRRQGGRAQGAGVLLHFYSAEAAILRLLRVSLRAQCAGVKCLQRNSISQYERTTWFRTHCTCMKRRSRNTNYHRQNQLPQDWGEKLKRHHASLEKALEIPVKVEGDRDVGTPSFLCNVRMLVSRGKRGLCMSCVQW